MSIEQFSTKEFIKIVDVSLIKQGDMLWKNGDIVQIKDVESFENRIEVWNTDKSLSELIYVDELNGIEKVCLEKFVVYKDVYGSISEPEHTSFEYEVGETICVNSHNNLYKCMKKEMIEGKLLQYFNQGKMTYTFDY